MNQRLKPHSLLLNPFVRYGDNPVYLIGGIIFLLTIALAYYTGTHLSGFFLYRLSSGYPWMYFAGEQLFHLCLSIILFYVSGALLSKSRLRFIDTAGTLLIARTPLIIPIVLRCLPLFESFVIYSTYWSIYKIIFYVCALWSLVLTYHAIGVSSNLSTQRLSWIYVSVLLLTETLTYFFIRHFLQLHFLPL